MASKCRLPLSLICSGLVLAGPLAAAQDNAVIVTATRTAQTADANLAPVVVIERDDIERYPAADISELLRLHAGIELGRTGGPGQQSSIFIRGAESDHTLVMIDGVEINPGTIGIAPFERITSEMIERIEIVKGPRSTLYGSHAIGGVINIITRRAVEDGTRYSAAVGGGSHNTAEAKVSAHRRLGDKAAGITVSGLTSDGIAPRVESPQRRGHDNLTLHLYGMQRLEETDAEISHWHTRGNTEYLDFFLTPLDQDFENTATALKLTRAFGDTWASTLRLSRLTDEVQQSQSADYYRTRRVAADWQNDVQVGEAQLLTAGLYAAQENTRALIFGSGYDEDTEIYAAYLQDDIQLGSHRLLLGGRYTNHQGFGGHTSWDLQYGYDLTAHTRLVASAGTGFRAPDSTDRFGFGGNPDLQPETSRNLEAGVRFRPSPGHAWHANVFENRIDDLIAFEDPDGFEGPIPGRMENIERARIRGAELGYAYRQGRWSTQAQAAYHDPKNLDDGSRLLRRAKHNASLGVGYQAGTYRLGADVLYAGERRDVGDTRLDSYTLLNLSAEKQLSESLRLIGRVENALDEDYQLVDRYNTQGRAGFLELRYAPGGGER